MKRKYISLILVVLIMFNSLPLGVFAEPPEEPEQAPSIVSIDYPMETIAKDIELNMTVTNAVYMDFSNDNITFTEPILYVDNYSWDITEPLYGGSDEAGEKKTYINFYNNDLSKSTNHIITTNYVKEEISDVVIFADEVLEGVIRDKLNKPTGDITKNDMESITELTYSGINENPEITDLIGLQYATNLTKLELKANNISTLSPLNNLVNLKHLNLQANKIVDITPLENLLNLQSLYIHENSINISNYSFLENINTIEVYPQNKFFATENITINISEEDSINFSGFQTFDDITFTNPISIQWSNYIHYEIQDTSIIEFNNGIIKGLSEGQTTITFTFGGVNGEYTTAITNIEVKPLDIDTGNGTIVLNHIDVSTNEILETETFIELELGVHTIYTKEFDGYTFVFAYNSRDIIITKEGETINVDFIYSKDEGLEIGHIEVRHIDEETNEIIEIEEFTNLEFGKHTVYSKTFEGYSLRSSSSQDISLFTKGQSEIVEFKYLSHKANIRIIHRDRNNMYGYLSIEDIVNKKLGTHTVSSKIIEDYTLDDETTKNITLSVKDETVVVEFFYLNNANINGTIKVNHIDEDTSEVLETEIFTRQLGTHTVDYTIIEGYTLNDEFSKDVILSVKDETVVVEFKYGKSKGNITVSYVDEEDRNIIPAEWHSDLLPGDYTFTAKDFEKYELNGIGETTVNLTSDNLDRAIKFRYKKVTGSITLRHMYNGTILNSTTTNIPQEMGEHDIYHDPSPSYGDWDWGLNWWYEKYELNDDTNKTVLLTKDNPNQIVDFQFKKLLGGIIVNRIDEDNYASLDLEVLDNLEMGEHNIFNDKEIEGYELNDIDTKQVYLTSYEPNQEIQFKYKKIIDYSVLVIAKDLEGNTLRTENQTGLTPEGYSFPASVVFGDIEGYQLADEPIKNVYLTKENPQQTITFYYEKQNTIYEPTNSVVLKYSDWTFFEYYKSFAYKNLRYEDGTPISLVNGKDETIYYNAEDYPYNVLQKENGYMGVGYSHTIRPSKYLEIPNFSNIDLIKEQYTIPSLKLLKFKVLNKNLKEPTIHYNIPLGMTVFNAPDIEGYKVLNDTIEFDMINLPKVGHFKYIRDSFVYGNVKDNKGISLPNVSIVVDGIEYKTDENGYYKIDKDMNNANKLTYSIQAIKEGYYASNVVEFSLVPNIDTTLDTMVKLIDFTLSPITVNKANIEVNYIDENTSEILDTETFIKDLGTHTVNSKEIKGYTLADETTKDITLSIKDETVVVEFMYSKIVIPTPIEPTPTKPTPITPIPAITKGIIKGRVISSDGKPIEKAKVLAISNNLTSYNTETDKFGNYIFNDLKFGEYVMVLKVKDTFKIQIIVVK